MPSVLQQTRHIPPGQLPPLRRISYKSSGAVGKADILIEFWRFLLVRKKYWLLPIALVLVLLSLIIVTVQGSALAPFIYALF